jgi:hypothetical protein
MGKTPFKAGKVCRPQTSLFCPAQYMYAPPKLCLIHDLYGICSSIGGTIIDNQQVNIWQELGNLQDQARNAFNLVIGGNDY